MTLNPKSAGRRPRIEVTTDGIAPLGPRFGENDRRIMADPYPIPGPPVLDERKMSELVALMGRDWVTSRLNQFAADIEARLETIQALTPAELAGAVHQMAGMAGYCGFTELGDLCASIQRDARQGGGADRIDDLRAAAARTIAVIGRDVASATPPPDGLLA